jgi:hypothetical protein
MKSGKPRGPIPSLIGSTLGAPRKGLVERESHCNRCNAPIPKGVKCYEIPQLGGSFVNYKRYCDGCFLSILEKTKADVDALLLSISNCIGPRT